MFEDTNDSKNVFVSISGLHNPRTDRQSVCCCKTNGNYREVGLYRGLYSDTAEGNSFINAKLDTEQPREHITGCSGSSANMLLQIYI